MTDDILFLFLLLPVFSYTFLGKISIWMSHKTAEDFRRADVREREREREQNRTEQNKTEQKERERERERGRGRERARALTRSFPDTLSLIARVAGAL